MHQVLRTLEDLIRRAFKRWTWLVSGMAFVALLVFAASGWEPTPAVWLWGLGVAIPLALFLAYYDLRKEAIPLLDGRRQREALGDRIQSGSDLYKRIASADPSDRGSLEAELKAWGRETEAEVAENWPEYLALYRDDTGFTAADYVSNSGMGDNLRWLDHRLDRLRDIMRSPR